ncbi:MAG: dihydrodipicolinate synthase family protein [Pseudomonadota bacterium]
MPGVDDLKGLFTPVLTPFTASYDVDQDRYVKFCKWVVSQGAGLACFGTNSEANSLSVEERIELLDLLVDAGIGPEKLMPGNGACALPDAYKLSEAAARHKCAATLMLPPFYYKGVSDEGLFRAYASVIEHVGSSDLRICLYHIPQVSGVPITLNLIEQLLARYPETVVGIKDSSGDWSNTKAMLDAFPGFKVFPGAETFLLDGMRNGAVGCISATANINPGPIAELAANWQGDDADDKQAELDKVRSVVTEYAPIPALKATVAHHGGDEAWRTVRPPLVELDEAAASGVVGKLDGLGFQMPGLADALA